MTTRDQPNANHDSHVMLFQGFDVHEFLGYDYVASPCLYCLEKVVILTEEVNRDGQFIHFVQCPTCGTRGPMQRKESLALASWNAAWHARTELAKL